MPFITVVIPLYNKANFIENTLQSVFNQSFQDFEIVIVEDCSTDNSLAVVSKIKSNKIRLIKHEKNKGLSASRNTGVKNANSNYIAFLDADDVWHKDYLKKINDLIIKFPEAKLFATNYAEVYPNNAVILPTTNLKNFTEDGIVTDFFESNLSQPIYCCCSLCVEKEVFEKAGYFDEKITFGEDVDFNIRANYYFKLAYSTENLVSYIMYSENRMSHDIVSNKTITDFDHYENWGKKNPSLKKFLDFNRYVMAKHYKFENDKPKFRKMKSGIAKNNEISGLNKKQLLLLNAPLIVLKFIKIIKYYFVKFGIRITTYG